MKNLIYIIFSLIISVTIISCEKAEEINPNDKNSVSIEFENRIADQKLVLGSTKAKNSAGEDFTVTTLNYFVSNISLKNQNGETIKFPNEYFLVRQADANSLIISLKNVPAGNYTELNYTIGVDSLKSISDVSQRTGVLDPASYGDDNMYWSWNSGYIFFKMEGNSSIIPRTVSAESKYKLHIGGFGGRTAATPNNLKTVSLPLTTPAQVRKDIAPTIHIINDVSKVFGAVNTISLAKSNEIMSPMAGKVVAENYAKAFILDHVHNNKD